MVLRRMVLLLKFLCEWVWLGFGYSFFSKDSNYFDWKSVINRQNLLINLTGSKSLN